MKNLIIGLAIGILITSCMSAPKFAYKYYALDAAKYDGYLRGPKPTDDLKLDECLPSEADKSPCVVMKRAEFFNLKKDFIQGEDDLIQCQRGN